MYMENMRRLPCVKKWFGSVRRKIDEVFGNTLSRRDKKELATLICYPKEKLAQVKETETNMEDWYMIHLYRLIEVSKRAASKYTRSKVRKALPKDFAYVIEELITELLSWTIPIIVPTGDLPSSP